MRTIDVFIVRHGERKDEALRRQGVKALRSRQDILGRFLTAPTANMKLCSNAPADPRLTELGYIQSRESFESLFKVLTEDRPRKIAVFASPLSRTIGTALALSAASISKDNVQWYGNQNDGAIPVVVVNGLCDCTAAVNRMGGAEVAVYAGFVPCADQASNHGANGPMVEALASMQATCAESFDGQAHNWLQFSRFDQRRSLQPMAPPVSAKSFRPMGESVSSPNDESNRRPQMSFYWSLVRAVDAADDDGCDTVIVVGHREGIRDLVERCGQSSSKIKTHYCCIASSKVELHDRATRWVFRRCSDFQDFGFDCLP